MTRIRTLRESIYFQPIKLAGTVANPNDVFPAPPDLIDVSFFHGFTIFGTLRAGDAPLLELVAATDANGGNLTVISTADLTAETVADGDTFMIDVSTDCLDGCNGYSYVGLRVVTPDASGDVFFVGYDSSVEPVTPPTYVFTACECCCD